MNLRPATSHDLEFLSALTEAPEVEPFLAPGAGEEEALGLVLERMGSGEEPHRRGAYRRRGQWLDGIIFGLLSDELVAPAAVAGSA